MSRPAPGQNPKGKVIYQIYQISRAVGGQENKKKQRQQKATQNGKVTVDECDFGQGTGAVTRACFVRGRHRQR